MKLTRIITGSKKTVLKVATLAVGLGLTLGLFAMPSSASAAYANCADSAFCLWVNPNGNGNYLQFIFANPGDCYNLTNYAGWNDVASSYYNRRSHSVTVYEHINCTFKAQAGQLTIPAGGGGIGNFQAYLDDDVSSVRFN